MNCWGCLLLLILTAMTAFGQKEASNWYFGNNGGLSFNSGSPVPLFDGQLLTNEGSAVISDREGNLLFYTNGVSVWNRNHQLMPNGTELAGSITSTQSALIVPWPESERYYYIFTVAPQGDPGGFSYSVVDISLDKGNGDIIEKNELLYTPTTEKLAATYHSNGIDIWVISHRWESDEFYTYLVTKEGILDGPVISKVGLRHEFGPSNQLAVGPMKISPQGNSLAVLISGINVVELFQFSSTSGQISNPITISGFDPLPPIYGLEFSPNGHYMFVSEEGHAEQKSKLFRFTVHSHNRTDIINSKEIIAEEFLIRGLQLAVDYKIYIAVADMPFVGVINYPNNHNNPEVIYEAVNLQSSLSRLGLPNFVSNYFMAPQAEVVYPNAFSPNGDDINDQFEPIKFTHVEDFTLKVLDRNGKELHSSAISQTWNGGNHSAGIYYWILSFNGINGASGSCKGWVTILK